MKTQQKVYQEDMLSKMLREFPLEQPSSDFTKKVMTKIPRMGLESVVHFYQKPVFISLVSIGFAACFLLFYYADFSVSVLSKQLGNYYTFVYDYISSLSFTPRQITFSPVIVAPFLLLFCIFVADRALAAYKKYKHHQIFCI